MASMLSEVSTPLMNLRALLLVHEKSDKLCFKVNDITFGILFIISRIMFLPFLNWRMIQGFSLLASSYPMWRVVLSWFHVMLHVSMYMIQIIWIGVMVKALVAPGVVDENAKVIKKKE